MEQSDLSEDAMGQLVHQAVVRKDSDLLRDLLTGGRSGGRHVTESRDRSGRTPLHVAVQFDDLNCTAALLEAGADADALFPSVRPVDDESGTSVMQTAVHIAVRNRNYSLTCCLLTAGADPNMPITFTHYENDDEQQQQRQHHRHHDLRSQGHETKSTALTEAVRMRDAALVDLLMRFGGRDDEGQALSLAAQSNDSLLVSKLLTLKSFADPEFRISRRALDLPGFCPETNSGNNSTSSSSVTTFSSVFPTVPVVLNWSKLNAPPLQSIRKSWLVDSALAHNVKLKVHPSHPSVALVAITRIDLSHNGLKRMPLCLFQLPSLRVLNLSDNRLTCLPETSSPYDDEEDEQKESSSRMRKSSSYSCSLTSSSSSSFSSERHRRSLNHWLLPCLEELHLQDNGIESLPVALFDLPALQLLDVSNNKIRCLPSRLWSSPRLRDLNASMNLMRELPQPNHNDEENDTLFESTNIPESQSHSPSQSTTVRQSQPSSPKPASQTSSTDSKSRSQSIFYIKSPLQQSLDDKFIPLPLRHHNLHSSELKILRQEEEDEEKEAVSNSCPLQLLNLSHNGFTAIPSVLSCVAVNLSRLNLSYNCITSMGSIRLLPNSVRHVDLSFNQVTSWAHVNLSEKEMNSCCCHQHESRDSGIKKLCRRRRHVRLENLRSLFLSNNQLASVDLMAEDYFPDPELSDDFELLNITEKSSSTDRSKSLLLFPNLSLLDLSHNKIRSVPASICQLSQLSVLHLSGNAGIARLPPEMGLLSKLWNLSLKGCHLNEPLKSMVERQKVRTTDLIGYLKAVLMDAKPYARMKLMVVGVQGIGKTCLLESLRHEGHGSYRKPQPDHWTQRMAGGNNSNPSLKTPKGVTLSTVGVDLCDWTFEKKSSDPGENFGPVTFRTWDFGGQQEYYATHQYFLTKRSLYIVVWKMSDGESAVDGIGRWLVNIQTRAPNSPVIIVGTHCDIVSEFFPESYVTKVQALIRCKFIDVVDSEKLCLPRVVDSIAVSSKTKTNIRHLCHVIYDTAFGMRVPGSRERLLEQRIPSSFLALGEVVNILATNRLSRGTDPVLTLQQFRHAVSNEMERRFRVKFRDERQLQQATTFLHENGVLMNFSDATLCHLIFLQPQWLCDMLSHVVTVRQINCYAVNGVMKPEDLMHLFRGSATAPSDAKGYIIALLNKFEVAVAVDARTLLIPSLLPNERKMRNGVEVRIPAKKKMTIGKREKGNDSPRKESLVGEQASAESPAGHSKHAFTVISRPERSIYRIVLMTYFPSGFFARLMCRILGDDCVAEAMHSFYSIDKNSSIDDDDTIHDLLSNQRAEWICWQTGISLTFLGHVVFRLREQMLSSTASEVDDEDIAYSQPDVVRLLVKHDDSWSDAEVHKSSVLELYIPNHCLRVQLQNQQIVTLMPNPVSAAKLLALAVEHMDTLLEDWYPALGTRFVHTSQGRALVTRLVPCSACMHAATGAHSAAGDTGFGPKSASGIQFSINSADQTDHSVSEDRPLAAKRQISTDGSVSSSSGGSGDSCYESAVSSRNVSANVVPMSNSSTSKQGNTAFDDEDRQSEDRKSPMPCSVHCFLVEECILAAVSERRLRCPSHGDVSLKRICPDAVFVDLGPEVVVSGDCLKKGPLLGRGAFGFVFRATIRMKEKTEHQQQSHRNKDTNRYTEIEVAAKMLTPTDPSLSSGCEKADAVAYQMAHSQWLRDPMAQAVRAHCDARREIRIQVRLRHAHIVPLVAVCTRPLALMLEVAPGGSLDAAVRSYRRSGAMIAPVVVQKVLLQTSRALEYLHQQHIIYRDLKSENILIWQMPEPWQRVSGHNGQQDESTVRVHVKLADYGISRQKSSPLPASGAKGFGGTEGFMAPEIMRFNGEEEYTESVDVFSFAMLMYELLALKLPFEGQELTSVRDVVLDGGRPALTHRQAMCTPSNLLDLMVRSWSEDPKSRPTASHIVSIVSAPEFVTLCDSVPLVGHSVLLSSAAVVHRQNRNNKTDLWVGRVGKETDILSVNGQRLVEYKVVVALNNVTITSITSVRDDIWSGDSDSCIHIMRIDGSAINSSIRVCQAVTVIKSLVFSEVLNVVFLCTSDGRLFHCDAVTHVVEEIGTDGHDCHCLTVVPSSSSSSKTSVQVWSGCGSGLMLILTFDCESKEVVHRHEINHYDENSEKKKTPVLMRHDVFQLLSNQEFVFAYLFPGCVVFQWSVSQQSLVRQLDVRRLAPCSESLLTSVSMDEILSDDNCRLTAMALMGDELFIGTTGGCLVVIQSCSMRPVTVFRPHERDIRAIVTFEVADDDLYDSRVNQKENQRNKRSPGKRGSSTSCPPADVQCDVQMSRFLLTVGQGCRNLLSRFLVSNLTSGDSSTPETSDKEKEEDSSYALLWKSGAWNTI